MRVKRLPRYSFVVWWVIGMAMALVLVFLPKSNLNLFPSRQTVDLKSRTKIKRVLVLEFNPRISGSTRIREYKGWGNPEQMESDYIKLVSAVSGGNLDYNIVKRIDNIDVFPTLVDGFRYSKDNYLKVAEPGSLHHIPDKANYGKILDDFKVCEMVNKGEIDELWMWGGPWFGFYESTMTGVGSYGTNGPVILNSKCERPISIMGFSYERSVDEMLEDLGHRIEGTMGHITGEDPRFGRSTRTVWGQFVNDCGWMHQPPNVLYWAGEYDAENKTTAKSNCDSWINFPNLANNPKETSCLNWGCSFFDFKLWWLKHIPRVGGESGGILNNWWGYL